MNVYAFASRVIDYSGHPFHYHLSCQQAIEGLGGTYHAYISLNSSLPSLPCRWHRWFPSLEDRFFFRKQAKTLVCQSQHNPRTFFIETFVRRDFKAFAHAVFWHAHKTDCIWILFRDDHIWKRKRDRRTLRLWIWLLKLKFGNQLHLLTDSDSISIFFQDKFKMPLTTLPLPHVPCLARPLTRSNTRHLLFIGEPRLEKGSLLIHHIAHSQEEIRHSFDLTCSEQLNISEPTITLKYHSMHLDQSSYFHLIEQSDIVLLPYSPYRYRRRTSGIFVESIFMGKIPIVTEGTWMSDELRKFQLEELIMDFTHPHFFARLEQLLKQEDIYKKLQAMQSSYQKFHSLPSFQQKIKNLIT